MRNKKLVESAVNAAIAALTTLELEEKGTCGLSYNDSARLRYLAGKERQGGVALSSLEAVELGVLRRRREAREKMVEVPEPGDGDRLDRLVEEFNRLAVTRVY